MKLIITYTIGKSEGTATFNVPNLTEDIEKFRQDAYVFTEVLVKFVDNLKKHKATFKVEFTK